MNESHAAYQQLRLRFFEQPKAAVATMYEVLKSRFQKAVPLTYNRRVTRKPRDSGYVALNLFKFHNKIMEFDGAVHVYKHCTWQ